MINPIKYLLALLYRNTNLPYRCYTSWIFIVFDQFGIEFPYKGDIIIWLWPWRRKNTKTSYHDINKYVSLSSEGYFNNLDEIDKFWESFKLACQTNDNGDIVGPENEFNEFNK